KSLFTSLGKFLTPMMQRTVSNAQVTGNLRLGFPTRLRELNCLQFEFLRIRSLWMWHDALLLDTHSQVYILQESPSRPLFGWLQTWIASSRKMASTRRVMWILRQQKPSKKKISVWSAMSDWYMSEK